MLNDRVSWDSRSANIEETAALAPLDPDKLAEWRWEEFGLDPKALVFFRIRGELYFRFSPGPGSDIDPLNATEHPESLLHISSGPALVIAGEQLYGQLRAIETALKDYRVGKIELGLEEIERLRAALPENPVQRLVGYRKTEVEAALKQLEAEIKEAEE
jgi:hypothetical protein